MDRSPDPQHDSEGLSLIVFAQDEADNVAPVLEEILAWLERHEPSAELIFVDDGSGDDTAAIAESVLAGRCATVLRHPTNRGIGGAIKTGTAAARGAWVTFVPADGQVPPQGIGILRAAAARDRCPLVLSVYEARDDGSVRKLLSWGVRLLIRIIHGVNLRCEGPYLFRRELFDGAVLTPDSFFLNFEFPIRVLRAGHAVSVVEIPCRRRMGGRSKTANLRTIVAVAMDLVSLRSRLAREATQARP